MRSPACYGEKRFSDLCQGNVSDDIKLQMRQVRQFIRNNYGIDDCRAVDREGRMHGLSQLIGLLGGEAVTTAGACERRKVGIWEINAFVVRRQAHALCFERNEPKAGVVVNYYLDRQLVMHGRQKFAHQHVEPAVAAQRNYLARAIKRLDPIRLTQRRPYGSIVEGADDSLRSALPGPVRRPKRVQAGVEDECCVSLCQVADCPGNRLRMDAIGTSAEIRLLVQQSIPLATLLCNLVPKAAVIFRRHLVENELKGWAGGSYDAEYCGCTPPQHLRPLIDLNHGPLARQELRIGIIGADHQQ